MVLHNMTKMGGSYSDEVGELHFDKEVGVAHWGEVGVAHWGEVGVAHWDWDHVISHNVPIVA